MTNKFRIITEVTSDDLPSVQIFASALRQLAGQVQSSDLFQHELEARECRFTWLGDMYIEEQPPADWQPREYRNLSQVINSKRVRDAWTRMLDLPDFEVDDIIEDDI